jgi:hypothetical protein
MTSAGWKTIVYDSEHAARSACGHDYRHIRQENDMGTKAGKGTHGGAGKTPMTSERASAIQSHAAKTAGTVERHTFASRAMRAAAHNVEAGVVPAPSRKN